MKKWKIAVKDIRGEGYIDVVVLEIGRAHV